MYKPRYKFWDENKFPKFRESLDRIYTDSYDNYINCHDVLVGSELKTLDNFMLGLETYYLSIIRETITTEKNWINILNQLNSISLVVIPKKRDIYGATLGTQISINPDVKDELKQICIFHELGHIINNKWKNESISLSKEIYSDPKNKELLKLLDINDYKYIKFGFDLLDEVVAQEVAERVDYRLKKKKRPTKEERYNEKLFNHNPYLSNYTFYGELYDFAYKFVKNLDYVSTTKNCSENEYMLRFIRRSFDEDFIKNIGIEINSSNDKKREKLIILLACMGKIKAAFYEVAGLNEKMENVNVERYVNTFNDTIKRR